MTGPWMVSRVPEVCLNILEVALRDIEHVSGAGSSEALVRHAFHAQGASSRFEHSAQVVVSVHRPVRLAVPGSEDEIIGLRAPARGRSRGGLHSLESG